MRKSSLVVSLAVLAAAAALRAQSAEQPQREQPPVTFRSEVNYVEVDAVATDAQGNFVRDLTEADFVVAEDGKPQKVASFALVDIPIGRADRPLFTARAAPPDVKSNATGLTGRLYVIALDDLHTLPLRSTLVKNAAKQFIERNLADNDIAAVVFTSGRADASQEFTSNKPLLLASVDKFMGRKLRSTTLEKLDVYNNQVRTGTTGDRVDDPSDPERGYNARSMLGTLKNLSDYLAGVRGRRKALLFFSEGIDYDIYDVINNREASSILDNTRDMLGAATRANVSIYAIDPRGLTSLADETIEVGGAFPADPSLGISSTSMQNELRLSQDSLRVLADETGGIAVVNQNDFRPAFGRIVEDNSAYYILGYYPTNDRRDGRQRKIQVNVSRPGLTVRARRGYVAPRGKAPAATTETSAGTSPVLRELLTSPLAVSGLTFSVTAAPFKGTLPNSSVAVAVQIDGKALTFAEKEGAFIDTLEVSMLAVDAQGKSHPGDRSSVELKLRPQTHEAVARSGFRLLSRLNLPPGRYQLRVAAHESGGGKSGAVFLDLEVPDYTKDKVSMSGLLVTSAAAASTPTARPDEQLKGVLPGPPTTVREFARADTLSVFAEIYDNTGRPGHKIDITTSLLGDEGRPAFKTEEQRSSDEFQGGRGGFGHVVQVPLRDVAAGIYLLRVEARSRLEGVPPVSREIQLRLVDGGLPPPTTAPVASPAPPVQPAVPPPAASPSAAALKPAPASAPTPAPAAGPATPAPMTVVTVARGPLSGITDYSETVARNEEQLRAIWTMVGSRAPVPTVDFASTMIAAVFLGTRGSAGYQVEVTRVERDGNTLVVHYIERSPAPGTVSAQLVTTPYAIVGVPRHEGEVRFVRDAAQ